LRFLYKRPVARALSVLTGIYVIYYIYWRAAYTLNAGAPVFSAILLAAEISGVAGFLLFSFLTWNHGKAKKHAPVKNAQADVFVLVCGESVPALEATLIGCAHLRGRHTVYVADATRRPEIEDLAQRMGCRYVAVETGGHLKAACVNEALKVSAGEYIAVLDGDMVPQPDMLEKTLGFFIDEKTAAVQLPQEFYNLDSMQHGAGRENSYWHEQQLFQHVLQPGRDGLGSAIWCGSPSVIRRSALESIGGVATDSVTEDFLTSLRLNSKGWKIRFLDEALAFGTAPQSYRAFSAQRLRWARGAMKILKSRDNPLIVRGLTLRQRLSYFAAAVSYFGAFRRLIYYLTPAAAIFTGIPPVDTAAGADLLSRLLLYLLLMTLSFTASGRGRFQLFSAEKYGALKMTPFIKAVLSPFSAENGAGSETAANPEETKKKDLRGLMPLIAVLAAVTASFVYGLIDLIIAPAAGSFAFFAALVWSAFNFTVIVFALREVQKRRYSRKDFRFPVEVYAHITDRYGNRYETRIEDISRGGMSIILDRPKKQVYWNDDIAAPENAVYAKYADRDGEVYRLSEVASLNRVAIKSIVFRERALLDGADISLCLPGGAVSVIGKVAYDRDIGKGKRKIGFKFISLNSESKTRLLNFLYATAPRRLYEQGLLTPNGIAEKKRRFVLRTKSA